MKDNIRKKLELWASNNNWALSHPLDDERFWDFVIEVFNSSERQITEDDFYSVLIPYCEDEDILTENYIRYENGIEVLNQFTKSV